MQGTTITGELGVVQVDDARSAAAGLTAASPAVTATGITGDNSATWTPTVNVAVPGSMAANVSTATITHSVL